MSNSAPTEKKRFVNLIEAATADHSQPEPAVSSLGPSVGGDFGAPSAPSVTTLGSPVGGDKNSDSSDLGPSVGGDLAPAAPPETMLGPSVGDDGPAPSDLRLKEDVHRVGTTVFGLPLYQFKYRGQPETYEGVMAHEVSQVMPGAVSVGADGYYRVNYRALGTRMRRVS